MSDSLGRRGLLVFTSACQALPTLALWLVTTGHVGFHNIYWYYGAQGLAACFSSLAMALAYVADVVSPVHRAPAFGMLLASVSVGVILTPVITHLTTPAQVIVAAPIAHAVIVLYIALVLPESLAPGDRQPFSLGTFSPLRPLLILGRTTLFRRLTLCVMAQSFCSTGVQATLTYFAQDVLGFHAAQQAIQLAIFGVGTFLVNTVVLRPLLRSLGHKRVLIVGLVFNIPVYVALGLNRSRLAFYCLAGVITMGELVFPAVSAIKSINVSAKEQGSVQAAIFAARSLAGAGGPIAMGWLFKTFSEGGPGSHGHAHDHSGVPYIPGMPLFSGSMALVLAAIAAVALPQVVPDLAQAADTFKRRLKTRRASHPLYLPSTPTPSSMTPPHGARKAQGRGGAVRRGTDADAWAGMEGAVGSGQLRDVASYGYGTSGGDFSSGGGDGGERDAVAEAVDGALGRASATYRQRLLDADARAAAMSYSPQAEREAARRAAQR